MIVFHLPQGHKLSVVMFNMENQDTFSRLENKSLTGYKIYKNKWQINKHYKWIKNEKRAGSTDLENTKTKYHVLSSMKCI